MCVRIIFMMYFFFLTVVFVATRFFFSLFFSSLMCFFFSRMLKAHHLYIYIYRLLVEHMCKPVCCALYLLPTQLPFFRWSVPSFFFRYAFGREKINTAFFFLFFFFFFKAKRFPLQKKK